MFVNLHQLQMTKHIRDRIFLDRNYFPRTSKLKTYRRETKRLVREQEKVAMSDLEVVICDERIRNLAGNVYFYVDYEFCRSTCFFKNRSFLVECNSHTFSSATFTEINIEKESNQQLYDDTTQFRILCEICYLKLFRFNPIKV